MARGAARCRARTAASGAATGRIRRRTTQQKGADLEAPYRALSYQTLVDEFLAALPSPVFAERVMGDNAARLYGF